MVHRCVLVAVAVIVHTITTALLLGRYVGAAPAWPPVLVNDETRECLSPGYWGDECGYCWIRQGWRSIGYGVECPEEYNNTNNSYDDDAYHCFSVRNEACCSSGFSGYGDCDKLIFNEVKRQCTISLCASLPDGWARDAPPPPQGEYYDGRCPYDWEWLQAKDVACDDPCKDFSACGECARAGCLWSDSVQSCGPICLESGWGTCLGVSSDSAIKAELLCEEFEQGRRDDTECATKTSCNECIATFLPSDDSKSCRWVKSDADEQCVGCETCHASSCSGSCVEIDDCSASNLCEAATCDSCLLDGCYWILNSEPACYHFCPENWQCANQTEEVSTEQACKSLEDAFWDLEYCVGKRTCNSCLQSVLPSDINKTCTWFSETGDYVNQACSLECPRYFEGCEEVIECDDSAVTTESCSTLFLCEDCLAANCFWDDKKGTDPWTLRCDEKCSLNSTTCLSSQNVSNDESLFAYCLGLENGMPRSNCNITYPYAEPISQPCQHCLFNGCAWDIGGCRDTCTNATTANCTAGADLKGSSLRLEEEIFRFCAVMTEETNETVVGTNSNATISPTKQSTPVTFSPTTPAPTISNATFLPTQEVSPTTPPPSNSAFTTSPLRSSSRALPFQLWVLVLLAIWTDV